jgi:hypothetical protein
MIADLADGFKRLNGRLEDLFRGEGPVCVRHTERLAFLEAAVERLADDPGDKGEQGAAKAAGE